MASKGQLEPGESAVLVVNETAYRNRYGDSDSILGTIRSLPLKEGSLRIEFKEDASIVDEITYSDPHENVPIVPQNSPLGGHAK